MEGITLLQQAAAHTEMAPLGNQKPPELLQTLARQILANPTAAEWSVTSFEAKSLNITRAKDGTVCISKELLESCKDQGICQLIRILQAVSPKPVTVLDLRGTPVGDRSVQEGYLNHLPGIKTFIWDGMAGPPNIEGVVLSLDDGDLFCRDLELFKACRSLLNEQQTENASRYLSSKRHLPGVTAEAWKNVLAALAQPNIDMEKVARKWGKDGPELVLEEARILAFLGKGSELYECDYALEYAINKLETRLTDSGLKYWLDLAREADLECLEGTVNELIEKRFTALLQISNDALSMGLGFPAVSSAQQFYEGFKERIDSKLKFMSLPLTPTVIRNLAAINPDWKTLSFKVGSDDKAAEEALGELDALPNLEKLTLDKLIDTAKLTNPKVSIRLEDWEKCNLYKEYWNKTHGRGLVIGSKFRSDIAEILRKKFLKLYQKSPYGGVIHLSGDEKCYYTLSYTWKDDDVVKIAKAIGKPCLSKTHINGKCEETKDVEALKEMLELFIPSTPISVKLSITEETDIEEWNDMLEEVPGIERVRFSLNFKTYQSRGKTQRVIDIVKSWGKGEPNLDRSRMPVSTAKFDEQMKILRSLNDVGDMAFKLDTPGDANETPLFGRQHIQELASLGKISKLRFKRGTQALKAEDFEGLEGFERLKILKNRISYGEPNWKSLRSQVVPADELEKIGALFDIQPST